MGVNSLPKTVNYPTTSRLRFDPGPFSARVQHANHSATDTVLLLPESIVSLLTFSPRRKRTQPIGVRTDMRRVQLKDERERDVEFEGRTLTLARMEPVGWTRWVVGDVEDTAVYLSRISCEFGDDDVARYLEPWCLQSGCAVVTVRAGATGRALVHFDKCFGKSPLYTLAVYTGQCWLQVWVSCTIARRSCDCTASSAPTTNVHSRLSTRLAVFYGP